MKQTLVFRAPKKQPPSPVTCCMLRNGAEFFGSGRLTLKGFLAEQNNLKMGGCCCSSRKPQLHGTPVYYYYPPDSEEHESLTSHDGVATVLSSGLLIDLNLNMSTPDTYRSPPAPIPYDVVLGRPQSTGVESGEATITGDSLEKPSNMNLKDGNCRNQSDFLPLSPRKVELELLKSTPFNVPAKNEEEACPTCLEEYDAENPKIMTKCSHHFHLSCILEWMERSDTCPICDQEMIYEAL